MTRVLIVDDKPENLYLLRIILQGNDCEVTEARHGAEALALARTSPPNLVISDLLMPVMDGYTLLRHWKADERLRKIPFVVYTATYTDPKDERLALDLGADEFILKPAEPEFFMARINDVLGKQREEKLSAATPRGEEKVILKEYSEALIRKLEEKAFQLELSNKSLEKDIAERIKAEEALAQQSKFVTALVNTAPALVYVYDMETDSNVYSNEGTARILGYTQKEVQAMGSELFTRLIHPDDLADVIAFQSKVAAAGAEEVVEIEYRIRRADGEWTTLRSYERAFLRNPDGSLKQKVGVAMDVSERSRAEEAFRQAHQNYVTLIESINGIVWEADAQTFIFSFVSQQAERLLGYPVERWLSEPTFWKDHIHPDDQEHAVNYCVQSTRENRSHEFEYRMVAADGRNVWVQDIVTVEVENDRPTRLRGIMVDITERKHAEEELRASEERYALAERAVNDGLWDWNIVTHEAYLSPRWKEIVGYTGDELSNHESSFFNLIHADDKAAVGEAVRQNLEEHKHYEIEFRLRHKDGSYRWVLSRGEAVRDSTGIPVRMVGSITDITERKREENERRVIEEKLQLFIDHAPAALAMFDRNMHYVAASRRWMSDYRVGDADIIGRSHYDVFPEIPERWRAVHRRGLAGEVVRSEEDSFERADGHVEWLRWEVRPWHDHDGAVGGIVLFTEDITDRKKAEAGLRESEERYRAFIDGTHDLVQSVGPNGGLLFVNPAWEHTLGYTAADRATLNLFEIIHPDSQAHCQLLFERILNGELIESMEVAFVKKNGDKVILEGSAMPRLVDGEVIATQSFFRDITQRKRAEGALQRAQEMFTKAFRSSPDAILISVIADGRLIQVNDGFTRLSGYTSEEVLGRTSLELGIWVSAAARADFASAVKENGRVVNLEMQYRTKSGEVHDALVSGERIEIDNQSCILSVVRDISERKHAEESLRESHQQLRELASHLENIREEERKRIAREIHDELGQVLTAVKMDLTMLNRKLEKKDGVKLIASIHAGVAEDIALIDKAIKSIRKIAAELRPEALDATGLTSAIETHLSEFQSRSGVKCTFTSNIGDKSLARPSENALYRIVQEAITNIARHSEATKVSISLRRESAMLTLQIADNGKGFPDTVKPPASSFGIIGMRERAILLGGEFAITGIPGKGTTITVRIPVHPATETKPATSTNTGQQA